VLVKDVMSPSLFTCAEDDTVEDVFAQMRERQIRRMPVYDESGRVTGVVTQSDLARMVQGPEQIQEILRQISEPHRSRTAVPEEKSEQAVEPESDTKATAA
jgi:CBS-domain-containing membrane protein